ncbi:tripartite tricarboxylate transporter substrate binding protein [Roseomonas hellenica]|uniref:Tripartite tricarboxylate transporter substrate binding protein n=1 Tax=Plastoroseomonas hellenica TaxID=2687306 RepID=A0ABS5F2T0_9PROT|nr:tripartite tricarboxylate transporter substrate binding protein [Plastoroseomonas hellenica]MBR0666874.1 tripartite tricarboxylate transporter substrate binding protein [Plastoroseomonas hellenica]
MTVFRMPRRALLAGAATAALAPAAQAAWVPQQPIRILIGYPPGGAVDILVRVVAEGMQRVRGVAVVAEVRSGAYGFIAAQAAARSAPDGYTLASAIMGLMSVLPAIPGIPVPLDLDRELTPVSVLAGTPMALVARPAAPFNDVEGLIAYARQRGGAATYASSGNGSINHLGAALFCGAVGVTMTHVSYRGGAPATLDVSAGRIDIMVANVAEVAPQIRGGQLKGLGVTAAEPTPLMPELPPLAARIPALEINNWFGVAGPAGLPAEVRDGLAEIFAAAVRDPQTARILMERGLIPIGEGGAAFAERIRRDRARWAQVVQANNIRGD